jgi:hypothetical protein
MTAFATAREPAADRRALEPTGGARRLLRALIRRGLREEDVPAAAMLVLMLDKKAGR